MLWGLEKKLKKVVDEAERFGYSPSSVATKQGREKGLVFEN